MLHIIEHSVLDSLKLVPFLFLTYLAMEYLEHRAGAKTEKLVGKAGKFGPLIGGLLGAVPQCGFSAAASGLYAGRVISLGTLLAIYLSTSDEMLPILISEKQPLSLIFTILLAKIAIGAAAGFLIDLFLSQKKGEEHHHIHEICEHEHCHCEKGILRSAVSHTLQITFFVLLITFALNLILHFCGRGRPGKSDFKSSHSGASAGGNCGLDSQLRGLCGHHTALSKRRHERGSHDGGPLVRSGEPGFWYCFGSTMTKRRI